MISNTLNPTTDKPTQANGLDNWISRKITCKKDHPLYQAVLEELKKVGFTPKEKHPELPVILANLIEQMRKADAPVTRCPGHEKYFVKKPGEIKLTKARFDKLIAALEKAGLIIKVRGFNDHKNFCGYFKATKKLKQMYKQTRINALPQITNANNSSIQKLVDPEIIPHKRGYLKLQKTTKSKKDNSWQVAKTKEYIQYNDCKTAQGLKGRLSKINNRYTSCDFKIYFDSRLFIYKVVSIIVEHKVELMKLNAQLSQIKGGLKALESTSEAENLRTMQRLTKLIKRRENRLLGLVRSLNAATNFDVIIQTYIPEIEKILLIDRGEEITLSTVREEILIKCQNTPDLFEITADKITVDQIFSKVGEDPDWKNGGRFYSPIQALPSRLRRYLLINGEVTVEIDYSAFHPTILYHEKGLKPDNPYIIDGIPRDLVKVAFNVMLNCGSRRGAIAALAKKVNSTNPDEAIDVPAGLSLETLVKKIEAKHEPIKDSFYSSAWGRLQRLDSKIAQIILLDKDLHCIGVHDSFLVPRSEAELLATRMSDLYKKTVGTTSEPVLTIEGEGIEKTKFTVDTLNELLIIKPLTAKFSG